MLLSGATAMRPRAGPLPLLYPLGSYGPRGGVSPLLKSVARIGLSHTSSLMLLLKNEASHARRSMASRVAHSAATVKSFVRLSSGSGTSLALLNANAAPHGWWPVFFVELKTKLTATSC